MSKDDQSLYCWHQADMARCQVSQEKAKSSVEVVQTVQLFQDYLGEHSGFSVESLSEFDIYSLCACDVCFQTALNGPSKLVSCLLHFCYVAENHNVK